MKTLSCTPYSSIISISGFLRTTLFVSMFTITLLFIIPLSTLRVYAQEGATIHVVVAGENLSSIARRYNVSVATLMAYNNISNANIIRPGQPIRIPASVPPAPPAEPAPANTPVPTAATEDQSPPPSDSTAPVTSDTTVPAQTGDNSTSAVATSTPVPTSPPRGGGASGYTAAGEPVYTVRRGDTLSGIASLYGVTVSSILLRNQLGSPVIIVSQRLIIPLGTAAPIPTNTYQPPVSAGETPVARSTVRPTSQTAATAQPTPTSRVSNFLLITATPTPRVR